MLTYEINRNKITKRVTNIEDVSRNVHNNESELEMSSNFKGIFKGDEIDFVRQEGDYIDFSETKYVSSTEGNHFRVPSFSKRMLSIKKVEMLNKRWWRDDAYDSYFIVFTFSEGTPHNIVINRKIYDGTLDYIKELFYGTAVESDVNRHCAGDYILYEDMFLYQASSVTDGVYYLDATGKTLTESECFKNICDVNLELLFPASDINKVTSGEIGGDGWYLSGSTIVLTGCIVPVASDGKDSVFKLIWPCRSATLKDNLILSLPNASFFVEDRRFYTPVVGSVNEFTLIPATEVHLVNNSINLFNLLGNSMDVGLGSEYTADNIMNKEIENYKNAIIDYEKQVFNPVYVDSDGDLSNLSNSSLRDVSEIIFNLHFRDRWEWNELGTKRTELSEEWKTDDDKFWNNYEYDETMFSNEGGIKARNSRLLVSDADLVGHLGFTDDDIYYRKKKVSKSFLRLSFYDSKDRQKQNLLFTSTIFLDDSKLYNTYIKLINERVIPNSDSVIRDGKESEAGYVLTEATTSDGDRLSVSFSCKNKYDSLTSSEGFYLYMFPSLLNSLTEISGYDEGLKPIYMKAEFNHAKYGYKIPLTMPTSDLNRVYLPEDSCFPVNYLRQKSGIGNKGSYIDSTTLFSDMYILLFIKYDADKKRYVWMLPRTKDSLNGGVDGKVYINLFEPKINGGTNDSYNYNVTPPEVKKKYINCRNIIDDEIDSSTAFIKATYVVEWDSNIRLYAKNFSSTRYLSSVYIDNQKVSTGSYYYNLSKGTHTAIFVLTGSTIPNSMFAGNTYITEISEMQNMREVGTCAFAGCRNLKKITLYGITTVGTQAFQGARALEEITEANDLLYIETAAFGRTNIQVLPEMPYLGRIGDFGFSKCYKLYDINGIDIANIQTGKGVFMDCGKLYGEGRHDVRQNYTLSDGTCNTGDIDKGRKGGNVDMYFNFAKKYKTECKT